MAFVGPSPYRRLPPYCDAKEATMYNQVPEDTTALLEVKREPAKKKQFCKLCDHLYEVGDPVVTFRWSTRKDDWGIAHEECFDSFDATGDDVTVREWRSGRTAPAKLTADPNQLALREDFNVRKEGRYGHWWVYVNDSKLWYTTTEKEADGAIKFILAVPAVQEALR
jgi:hypothetical protein